MQPRDDVTADVPSPDPEPGHSSPVRHDRGGLESAGDCIGPYRLLEQLGEGGFGVVYAAEQTAPVKRRVALKILKPGMDTRAVLGRFDAERQALALMDHTNIARVLDAGATERGRPYFVMELVRGDPITQYCDRNRLSTNDRLRLFIDVCHAVQHAHQKGVIHRDIKPTNILVTVEDGRPVPKVIDFGIAKAASGALTAATLYTMQGQLIGTPAYMSPEQAERSGVDVDTRTDIYSLGAVLYELLTGTPPISLETLHTADISELQRIIRDVEPARPSVHLSTIERRTARDRRTADAGPARSRQLKGDLDWVVLKAMSKDRTQRYATANALALELERYLNNEPVMAGPPATLYRARKFVRRNRVAVTAGSAVAAALVIGLTLATIGLVRASEQRDRAEVARDEAQASLDFLTGILSSVDPREAQGDEWTVREMVDQAAERIERSPPRQPLVEAQLRHTLGRVYRSLSVFRSEAPQ
ncbi:MAG: serine/threonine-protein kinase, partial [Planctomycetota bacterium]|nr:serine/threonine-protein kinase [Planctomycetota bacterium]